MRHLAIANGAFGWCQAAIFEGFEDSRFRGGDAGVFQDVVRPVGKAVVWKPFVIVAGIRQRRGVNAGPLAKIPVRIDAVGGRVAMRVEFAVAQGGSDGLLLDGKAGFGQKMIDPFRQAVGGKLDFVASGLINLRGPTSGAVEPVADLLKGQFFLVPQAEHQRLASGLE